jgi:hypothetical protein
VAVGSFADLAVAIGARRLVLLSGRGEEGALRGEQAVRDSGADWTIVRSAFMAQNFSESYFVEPVRAGEVAFPAAADLAEPFIDAADVADVAALTEDGHVGQLYEVTGPRLLSWADAVAEIAQAAGRRISYLPVSLEEYATLLIESQVPADLVKMLTDVFTEVLDGRNAYLTDGVQRALGRLPGTSPTTPATPPPPASGTVDAPPRTVDGRSPYEIGADIEARDGQQPDGDPVGVGGSRSRSTRRRESEGGKLVERPTSKPTVASSPGPISSNHKEVP